MNRSSDPVGAQLRSYYEREAELRLRPDVVGRRVELRSGFLARLASEGRRSLIDFGAGPGLDGRAFVDAGLRFVGLDLAIGNARLARELGVLMVPASIDRPPVRPRSFAAGWSMSTLMHLPKGTAATALGAMAECLEPGAPLMVALWGTPSPVEVDDSTIEGQRRHYFLRSAGQNLELMANAGRPELISTWDAGPDDWEYQVFLVRVGP